MKLIDTLLVLAFTAATVVEAQTSLKPDIRGVATRAPQGMKIDGDLSEFANAFATPLEYFQPEKPSKTNPGLKDRTAQFFYMWDDEAFYAALRTLDRNPANHAPDNRLWEGDAVEWYFDARQDDTFRSQEWPKEKDAGAVHCYWTGLKGTNVEPRFCLRPGFLEAIKGEGVEVAAKRTAAGMDVEFKLPWSNFPNFKAEAGKVIALDAELCYSDGKERVFRSFVFGSPLSVQQPASLGKIQLVNELQPQHWQNCGPVMFPIRADTAWTQPSKPQVTAMMALPPNRPEVGKVLFRVLRLDGKNIGDFEARIETFEA